MLGFLNGMRTVEKSVVNTSSADWCEYLSFSSSLESFHSNYTRLHYQHTKPDGVQGSQVMSLYITPYCTWTLSRTAVWSDDSARVSHFRPSRPWAPIYSSSSSPPRPLQSRRQSRPIRRQRRWRPRAQSPFLSPGPSRKTCSSRAGAFAARAARTGPTRRL